MKRYLVIAAALTAFTFTQCGDNHGGDANNSHQSSESEMIADTTATGDDHDHKMTPGSDVNQGAGNDIDRQGQTEKTPGQETSDAINEAGDKTSKAIDSTIVGDGKNN